MKNGIWTFVIGFVAGAASALLLAPQSGEETRELLADKARKSVDEGSKAVRDAAAKGADVAWRAKQQAQEAIETGKTSFAKAASKIE